MSGISLIVIILIARNNTGRADKTGIEAAKKEVLELAKDLENQVDESQERERVLDRRLSVLEGRQFERDSNRLNKGAV